MKNSHIDPDSIALTVIRWILAFVLVATISLIAAKHTMDFGASLFIHDASAKDLSWEAQKQEIIQDLQSGQYEDYSHEPTILENTKPTGILHELSKVYFYTKCIVKAKIKQDKFASHTCKVLITK